MHQIMKGNNLELFDTETLNSEMEKKVFQFKTLIESKNRTLICKFL